MLQLLGKNWWILLVKGILLVIFSILAFLNPGITLTVFAIMFAAFLMVDGVFTLIGVFGNWKTEEDKWLLVAEGVIGLLLGFLVYRRPESFISFIAFLIAFWAIFSGVSRIAIAIQLRKEVKGEGWLIASGLVSILFGIIVFAQPGIGIATLMWLIGIFALVAGIFLIMLSFKIRKAGQQVQQKLSNLKDRLSEGKQGS